MSVRNIRWYSAVLRWIPRVLMLGLIGFSAYVYFNYGREHEKKKVSTPPPPPRVRQDVGQIRYSHFDKGIRVYDVNAKRNKVLKSNAQQLEEPEFVFYDNEQRENIRITGKRCTISKDFNIITVIDDVEVKSRQGMNVNTRLLKYDYRLEQFSSPYQSAFHWKTLKGRSKGFVYDVEADNLILPDTPEVQYVNTAGNDRAPIAITGDRGAIDRKTGFGYFDGNVVVTQARDRIESDRVEVTFQPGGNDVQKITGRGNVRMKFAKKGASEIEPPAAVITQTEPVPAESSPSESNPPAGRQVAPLANVFTAEESSGKELEADFAEIFLNEKGNTIRSFHSTGNCTFILHTFGSDNKPFENRVIKGQKFDAFFNALGEMKEFHATEDVSVRVQPLKEARKETKPQTIYCKDLLAHFVPETGDVTEIFFNNEFRHVQEKRTISSDRAVYTAAKKKTDLIGNPKIEDASFTITSSEMELMEETNGINAKGNVKSTFVKTEGKTPTTFPFSSPSNQPVYISSENMEWNSHEAEAKYTGKAKLWQEKNVISAPVIVINDKEKTLSAFDKVHTIFYNGKEKKDTKAKGKKESSEQPQTQTQPVQQTAEEDQNKLFQTDSSGENDGPISVDAGTMNYVEKERIIHFEKNVKISTPTTKISSEKSDFFLKEQTSELDRLNALGNVQIQNEQKHGSGDVATFFAADQRLVLEGGPKLSEPGRADIHGRILTLFLTDGRILIDGETDGRATTTLEVSGSSSFSLSTKSKSSDSDKDTPDADSKNREPH